MKILQPGTYRVSADIATINANSDFMVEIGTRKLTGKATATVDWDTFKTIELGEIEILNVGNTTVNVRPVPDNWAAINLRSIHLTRVNK